MILSSSLLLSSKRMEVGGELSRSGFTWAFTIAL
jgi:hypothetical protein